MAKTDTVSIKQIATELGWSNVDVLQKAKELGFKVTATNSSVSVEEAGWIYSYVADGKVPTELLEKQKKSATKAKKPAKEPAKAKTAKTKKEPAKAASKTTKKTAVKKDKVATEIATKEPQTPIEPTPSPVEPAKIAPLQNEVEEESLAGGVLKRRGLVIIKKKKEESAPITPKIPKPTNAALEAMFSAGDSSLKKKKKEKKHAAPTSKKESSAKLDMFGGFDFSSDIDLDDDNVVMLPDLTLKPIEVEKPALIKKPAPNQPQTQQRRAAFGNDSGGLSRGGRKKHRKVVRNSDTENITSVQIPKEIRLYEFAEKIKKSASEVIGKLFMLGKMTTKNDFLEEDEIEILGAEFDIDITIVDNQEAFDYVGAYEAQIAGDENLAPRAPVVTIMGHVDHGKTSLLDYIRNSRVAHGEAGGITQHVGAYMVEKNGQNITFIDTPGHEAFTAMRARGASVTDIVIIVVAADDGVKPQTKEAIAHAKAAGVPIIVAINKMDKESANPDMVKTQLAELDIMPTEWGGSYEFVPISAKTGMGVEELLEIVLLQAEILELKASPTASAKAAVIESSLQKGRGPVATIIVENGTLKVGDTIVAGVAYGKVRALTDDKAKPLAAVRPGECGVIIGLSEVPDAGETLIAVKSDKEAREYAQKKQEYLRQKELSKSTKVTIDELSARIAEGELKSLPVILKADVQGSLEAIKASLDKLKNDEIRVQVIHSGVGGVSQSDIALASASENCIIIGFNIRPTGEIKQAAKESSVEIKTYNVIYNLIDDVKAILGGMMSPVISEEELGQAVIRQVISVPKVGQIAGCMVTDGSIVRGAKIRVIRDGVVVFEGAISSLKRFKDDAKEVAKGFECGVGIEGFNDMREGDYVESFKEVESRAQI